MVRTGRPPLFCRCSSRTLVGTALALVALHLSLPSVTLVSELTVANPLEPIVIMCLRYAPLVLSCSLWLWWSDAPALGIRRMAMVTGTWLACTAITQWNLINAIIVLPSGTGANYRPPMISLGELALGSLRTAWYLNPNVALNSGFFTYPPIQLLSGALFCGGLVWVLYRRLDIKPTFGFR